MVFCYHVGMTKHIADHIKAVLFDHDDTLIDTIGTKWVQHKYIAKTYYGKDLTDAEIIMHYGKPLEELVCLLYGTTEAEQAMAYLLKHHHEFPKNLFKETIPLLRHLRAKGLVTGVITAASRYSFEEDMETHKIPRELFDYTQTSGDTKFHKPDPRVFDPAIFWLATQNIKSNEVVYVGDGLHDMKAALGAGFSFIGVQTGLVSAKQFKEVGTTSISGIASLIK